jgi:hypothetical protein
MQEIAVLEQTRITHQSQLNENKRYLSMVIQNNQLIILGALSFAFFVGWKYSRTLRVATLFRQLQLILVFLSRLPH